ncbi:MAG: hypothetical protein BIFFINMI_02959 [Phycisphaerae bacterium]|nr:hypothetical protein [Phycisphaerae bacterium]
MGWQDLIAMLVVAAAAGWVVWRRVRRGRAGASPCGGCSGCAAARPDEAARTSRNFVPLDSLTGRHPGKGV